MAGQDTSIAKSIALLTHTPFRRIWCLPRFHIQDLSYTFGTPATAMRPSQRSLQLAIASFVLKVMSVLEGRKEFPIFGDEGLLVHIRAAGAMPLVPDNLNKNRCIALRQGPSPSGDDAKLKERESTPGAALASHRAVEEIHSSAVFTTNYQASRPTGR
ncbi:uncharacterized protein FOBCDRAFT_199452 [Fusarium oxysporum Fo47]|uniref:uncharacterized protein n=1 Tax=Fusarium oxysporum Fo47 TaxID=660027 RepID=UPI0028699AEA|nr:uncharacterized protein FOBCDRAFT_199452 [Fusarium oxysporum Fo47]WJG35074.1 hypothetical protein FOBCDRAFT_199452 [Fusarium oxysporum Fo47]